MRELWKHFVEKVYDIKGNACMNENEHDFDVILHASVINKSFSKSYYNWQHCVHKTREGRDIEKLGKLGMVI